MIAAVLHAPVDVIERWSPAKALAYFEKAIEVRKLLDSGK